MLDLPSFVRLAPRRWRAAEPRLHYLSGFEGTQIWGHGTDILDTTEHATRYREDFALMRAAGVTEFRACIPWHKVEASPGVFDWAWTDAYLTAAREMGLKPIADPLHHLSHPQWIEGGFANPEFPALFARYVEALARRHSWVTDWTVINEPLATAMLAGFIGAWYPHRRDREGVVPIILNKARGIVLGTRALERVVPGLRVVHVDTCERHEALDAASEGHAWMGNEIRFVVLDLILGRVDRWHPLWRVLRENGMGEDDAAWFRDNPARVDVLGLDYYAHSEMGWCVEGRCDDFVPWGFRRLARTYADRFGLPLMLSETNLRGRIEDRMSWLKFMVGECEGLARDMAERGSRFEGFCWYPFVDSTDWDSLCTNPARAIDPTGIVWLDEGFGRRESELSYLYGRLARGEIGSAELPAYRFEEVVLEERCVRKFLPLMEGWDWRDGEPSGV